MSLSHQKDTDERKGRGGMAMESEGVKGRGAMGRGTHVTLVNSMGEEDNESIGI